MFYFLLIFFIDNITPVISSTQLNTVISHCIRTVLYILIKFEHKKR